MAAPSPGCLETMRQYKVHIQDHEVHGVCDVNWDATREASGQGASVPGAGKSWAAALRAAFLGGSTLNEKYSER